MRPRPRWAGVLALALLAGPFLTGSSQAASTDVVPGSDPAALALLRSAVRAESTLTYGGVEDVTAADADAEGAMADDVVDVSHVAGEGTVLMAKGAAIGTRAGFLGADVRRPDLLVDLLQRSYRVVLGGKARVAGRPTHVVVVQRTDGRTVARFWVDDATGLLLRRDLVDRKGRTSASLAFRAVSMTGAPVSFLPPLLPTPGSGTLAEAALDRYAATGWPCADRLGGLSLFDARTVPGPGGTAGQGAVMHLSYSDGLSTVSVFVQRGRLDVDDLSGARRAVVGGHSVLVLAGHPRQVVWDAGGFVLTVVADADRDQVAAVVADLPHSSPAPAGWARVENGLSRMVSWVNPFD